ncbi:hypothetical protein BC834DRAFT_911423 [Gloeopeniophorella convolvens]|nr:hypothetical protein BC834DRAFT_911423 [Gloeopeniophorella convolvens]
MLRCSSKLIRGRVYVVYLSSCWLFRGLTSPYRQEDSNAHRFQMRSIGPDISRHPLRAPQLDRVEFSSKLLCAQFDLSSNACMARRLYGSSTLGY